MSTTSIEDILSGEVSASEPDASQAEAPPDSGGQPRDDAGRFRPRDDATSGGAPEGAAAPTSQVPAPAAPEAPAVPPGAGASAERERIAALEREIEALKKSAAPAPAAPAAPPAPPDFFADPDARLEHERRHFEQQLVSTKLDLSVSMARQQFADYDAAENAFITAAQSNPALAQQMLASPNPALFAYQVGKRIQSFNEIGPDPAAYRARLEAEIEARVRERIEAERGAPPPAGTAPPALPTPLAAVPAAAPRSSAPAFAGPTPFADILSFNRNARDRRRA